MKHWPKFRLVDNWQARVNIKEIVGNKFVQERPRRDVETLFGFQKSYVGWLQTP